MAYIVLTSWRRKENALFASSICISSSAILARKAGILSSEYSFVDAVPSMLAGESAFCVIIWFPSMTVSSFFVLGCFPVKRIVNLSMRTSSSTIQSANAWMTSSL